MAPVFHATSIKHGENRKLTNIKSYVFQLISVSVSFLNIRLFLEYLGEDDYATWLVVFSVSGLIFALDFGVGSSVRNQLARSLAKNSKSAVKARIILNYYKLICGLGVLFFLLGLLALMSASSLGYLDATKFTFVLFSIFLICTDFVSRAHHHIFAGLQQPQLTNLSLVGVQIFIFISISILLEERIEVFESSLITTAFVAFGGSVFVNALMFFRLCALVPILKTSIFRDSGLPAAVINFRRGFPFFVLQIQFAIISQIPLYFIYANFETDLVVEMAIADKVFSPFIILATVLMYPFWSTYTLLMSRKEAGRCRKYLKNQEIVAVLLLPALIAGLLIYEDFVKVWLERDVAIIEFAIFSAIKVFAIFWNSIYSYFMNGVGILRPQVVVYATGLIIAFPLLYLASTNNNIYLCLSVTPAILAASAIYQRHIIFKSILRNTA